MNHQKMWMKYSVLAISPILKAAKCDDLIVEAANHIRRIWLAK